MKVLIGCAVLLVVVVFLYEKHPNFFGAVNPAYGYNQQAQFDPQQGQYPAYPNYSQPVVQPYPQQPVYQYPQPPLYQPPVYQYPQPVCPYPPVCLHPHREVIETPWFRSYR